MRRRILLAGCLLALSACVAPSPPSAPVQGVVFFTADSAALDPGAQSAITAAAERARAAPGVIVHVRGFAAPDTGSPAFNRTLAQARAQAVADGLVAGGVAPARIRIESRGAVAYELMPTESRRVEIVVGP